MKLKQWIALLSFLLLFSITTYAGIEVYNDTVQAPDGHAIPSPTITVFATGTTNTVALYSNSTGSVKANPFTGDSSGRYSFFANDGHYDIKISKTGYTTRTKSYILIGVPDLSAHTTGTGTNVHGLGTLSTQNSDNVNITGGSFSGAIDQTAFHVHLSSNQTLTCGTETTAEWNTEDFDTNSWFDSGSPHYYFNPQKAGYYLLHASAYALATSGTYVQINIYKSGLPVSTGTGAVIAATGNTMDASTSIIVYMNGTNDTAYTTVTIGGASSCVLQAATTNRTFFEGILY